MRWRKMLDCEATIRSLAFIVIMRGVIRSLKARGQRGLIHTFKKRWLQSVGGKRKDRSGGVAQGPKKAVMVT